MYDTKSSPKGDPHRGGFGGAKWSNITGRTRFDMGAATGSSGRTKDKGTRRLDFITDTLARARNGEQLAGDVSTFTQDAEIRRAWLGVLGCDHGGLG